MMWYYGSGSSSWLSMVGMMLLFWGGVALAVGVIRNLIRRRPRAIAL